MFAHPANLRWVTKQFCAQHKAPAPPIPFGRGAGSRAYDLHTASYDLNTNGALWPTPPAERPTRLPTHSGRRQFSMPSRSRMACLAGPLNAVAPRPTGALVGPCGRRSRGDQAVESSQSIRPERRTEAAGEESCSVGARCRHGIYGIPRLASRGGRSICSRGPPPAPGNGHG